MKGLDTMIALAEAQSFLTNLLISKYGIGEDEITSTVDLDHLDIDSLALIEILLDIQKELSIIIPTGEITSQMSVVEAAEVIRRFGEQGQK